MFKICTVSAPGSLMLMGEHAVLHGFGSLSMAIDRRIRVRLNPFENNVVVIRSTLGHYESSLDTLMIQKPFQFILAAILEHRKHIKCGFELIVESEISDQMGLGSSAAVTVATVAVLAKVFDFEVELFSVSKQIVRKVQGGVGSGADVAASLMGGVVHYRNSMQKIEILPPIVVVYTGSKKSTTEVVAEVEHQRKKYPEIYQGIFKAIDTCVERACSFLHTQNWQALGEVMNFAQGLMITMGLSNVAIESILAILRKQPSIYGAKISGSGLGDCVIALGTLATCEEIKPIACSISAVGLCYE